MRGDLQRPGERRLNLLAGPQYRIGHHTVTFAKRPRPHDALMCDMFVEIDGAPPQDFDPVPEMIAKELFRMTAP